MDALYDFVFGKPNLRQLKRDLADTSLLKGLSSREVDTILEQMSAREFARGDAIFFEGDPGSALYIIVRGTVDIMRTPRKKSVRLATLTQGMFFGEIALVEDGPRSATAIAREQTTLLCFFKSDFENVLKYHPRLSAKLTLRLAGILAQRLRVMNERLENT